MSNPNSILPSDGKPDNSPAHDDSAGWILRQRLVESLKNFVDTANYEQLADMYKRRYEVTQEHIDFLIDNNKISVHGLRKLRKFWHDNLRFDEEHGTRTSDFISEKTYRDLAARTPERLADIANVAFGVKHRASPTRSIKHAFDEAISILDRYQITASRVQLLDMGCGLGKAVLYGAQNFFQYKQTIGVDYYKDVLEGAAHNAKKMKLENRVKFVHRDAATFMDFDSDVNVIYMYNPFGTLPMQGLINNMNMTNAKTGAKFIVTYTKPVHADLFIQSGWTEEYIQYKYDDPLSDMGTNEDDKRDPDLQLRVYSLGLTEPYPPTQ